MPYKLRLVAVTLILLSVVLSLTGCPGPAEKPGDTGRGEEPTISLYVDETGETKEIKLEQYLQGVVAGEMEPNWPKEALGAQAIMARTFTLKKIEEGGVEQRGTDASTNHEEFQAYDADKINDAVRQAVEDTRGEVIKHQGQYITAWFHADAGGKTAASPEEGGLENEGKPPYIQSVEDPGFEITTPENKSWTARFPLNQVRQVVQEAGGADPGKISSVEIAEKGPSGRALKIQLGDATVSAGALRLGLGAEQMRSTMIDAISIEGDQLVVTGKGFGHGVGMSQWGAKALAENGRSAQQIIKYFFKDISIEKEW